MLKNRQPELDGLRGIAALLVVFDHFGIADHLYHFPFGLLGVRLMFVLFGYFLVRQLAGGAGMLRPFRALGHFYLRRLPRLAAIMFVALAAGVWLGIDGARAGWLWHATFTTNYYIVHTGQWPGAFSHFWSLGMQVQFLLIAPLALLFVSPRGRCAALFGLLAVGPLYRLGCMAAGVDPLARWLLLPASLDTFALGGLLAVWEAKGGLDALSRWRVLWGGVLVFALAEAVAWHLRWRLVEGYPVTAVEFLDALAFTSLLAVVRSGVLARWLRPTLGCRGLAATGVVSYSLYALHPLVGNWLHLHIRAMQPWSGSVWPGLCISLPLALVVAQLAHRYVEVPIQQFSNRLADRFRAATWPALVLPRWRPAFHLPIAGAVLLAATCLTIPKTPSFPRSASSPGESDHEPQPGGFAALSDDDVPEENAAPAVTTPAPAEPAPDADIMDDESEEDEVGVS